MIDCAGCADFVDNNIGIEGAARIGEGLKSCPKINALHLGCTYAFGEPIRMTNTEWLSGCQVVRLLGCKCVRV